MGMNFNDNCLLLPSSKATEKSLPHPTFFLWDHSESWAYDYMHTLTIGGQQGLADLIHAGLARAMRRLLLRRSLYYSRLYPQFKYMTFIYSQPFIHHFTGLFGTNIMTSSQLAC